MRGRTRRARPPETYVKRANTINSIATGDDPVVIAGFPWERVGHSWMLLEWAADHRGGGERGFGDLSRRPGRRVSKRLDSRDERDQRRGAPADPGVGEATG